MEEKKENSLDLKSLAKTASAIQTLSDSLKELREQINQIKEGNISAAEGFLNITASVVNVLPWEKY